MKTVGQAMKAAMLDAARKRGDEIISFNCPDELLEVGAQAARDWQPEKEKTLGEVASDAFAVARLNAGEAWDDAWQAAGEACASIGAERERAWWRAWIAENCGDCDDVEQMLAVLADRGKEQQP